MTTQRIHVRTASGSYAVVYGRGLIGRSAVEIGALGQHTGVYLLSSPPVMRHWRVKIERGLRATDLRATVLFDDRETEKNMGTVERICRQLVRAGADRHAVLVAVGGGVVGDVAGFAAASFLRGVRLVHVPTTLVAQVDSAIGGKTGVNLPEGKNLVGAFYPPRLVLADPDTLSTLPLREFRSGLYEVIKYGVIRNTKLFSFLEKNVERVARRDAAALDFVIPRCIRAKAEVVSRDEREAGLREILNFGHTFAHALETTTRYRRYRHGEAVAWGMIAASRLAQDVGMLADGDARRVERLVRRTSPLPPLPTISTVRLAEIMRVDKKTRGGRLRFVLPRRIGHVETVDGISAVVAQRILANLQKEDFRSR